MEGTWLQKAGNAMSHSRRLRRYLGRPYLRMIIGIWNHLPAPFASSSLGVYYGAHLHRLIQLRSARRQYVGTFFFRNRPELELLLRLLRNKPSNSVIKVAVVACSKGAEAYSISYAIRGARPDLRLRMCAVDIASDVLDFAKNGLYSLTDEAVPTTHSSDSGSHTDVVKITSRDQPSSIFERMLPGEMDNMFDHEQRGVRVKSVFRDGITWHLGDARSPDLESILGPQDVVVANRFLCHMQPEEAEACLRNLARTVKPGGYLFVTGVDLNVRRKVARDLGWTPVPELIRDIHEGDPSLRDGWPLQYWGLEPFQKGRSDWMIRYASVFTIHARTSHQKPDLSISLPTLPAPVPTANQA